MHHGRMIQKYRDKSCRTKNRKVYFPAVLENEQILVGYLGWAKILSAHAALNLRGHKGMPTLPS